jgi:hypothetical protein
VTGASVITANGLGGTVATASTTPAITLNTTFTGVGYSNGTGFAASTAANIFTLIGTNLTGDCSLTTAGAITCLDTNGIAFGLLVAVRLSDRQRAG